MKTRTSAAPQIQKPRSSLELLKWLIFESVLLRRYSESLKWKQAITVFLKAYLWIALFSILLWLSVNFVISIFDLPSIYPDQFNKDILEGWQTHTTWFSKFIFLLKKTVAVLSDSFFKKYVSQHFSP